MLTANKRLLLNFFFFHFFFICVLLCVFMHVSVDMEAQGTILHVFPHIHWSRGEPDPKLTDMVSLAYQLALDSPCFCFLRLGCHAKETMVFGKLNSGHVCVASALTKP